MSLLRDISLTTSDYFIFRSQCSVANLVISISSSSSVSKSDPQIGCERTRPSRHPSYNIKPSEDRLV